MTLCPIDHIELIQKKFSSVYGQECQKCHGVWLPFTTVRELYNNFYLEVPAKIYHEFEPEIVHRSWPSKIKCPDDQELLTTYEFKKIEIDICGKCKGLWLDKGEIDKLRFKATSKDRVWDAIAWVAAYIIHG